MALKKRLSALILALVMVSSVSVTAFAYTLTEPPLVYDSVTDSYSVNAVPMEYIGDITFIDFLDYIKEVSLFSLPTEQNNRYVYLSDNVTVGLGINTSNVNDPQILSPINDTAAGLYVATPNPSAYLYNISNVTWENQYNRAIATSKGAYFDVYVLSQYEYVSTEKLIVEGSLESGLTTYYANVPVAIYPDSMYLLVNGEQVGDPVTLGYGGTGNVAMEYTLTEDVENVGFRFYFNSQWYNYASNIQAAASGYEFPVNLWFKDLTTWTTVDKDVNTGLLQGLLDWIIGIYNSVFVPDSQKDDADAFQNEVGETITDADNLQTELDQLEKPNPEDIDTDLSGTISDDAYTTQTQIYADLLKFDKITDMLMIVFTMALISYVLFGKKG